MSPKAAPMANPSARECTTRPKVVVMALCSTAAWVAGDADAPTSATFDEVAVGKNNKEIG